MHHGLRDEMAEKWDRDLPFEELLTDRWERAKSLGFGEEASIYQSAYVYGDVQVGEGTWVGPLVMLDGQGGLEIGSHCSISTGVQIYTHDTVRWALSGGTAEAEYSPVSIGDCTYVGAQTVIARGSSIGDHCVIGACSFVNSEIPPYSIAFGSPAEVKGRVVVGDEGQIDLQFD
ncbi:MAG: acyltransferase [Thermoleophilaceae bacterium]|nr:acyltransferase [Thermoleophilaceae bacterium]